MNYTVTDPTSFSGSCLSFLHQGNPYTRFTQTYCVRAKRVYGLSPHVSYLGWTRSWCVVGRRYPSSVHPTRRPSVEFSLCPRVIFLDCTALAGRLYHNDGSKGQFRSILVLSPGATLPHTQTTRHSPTKVRHFSHHLQTQPQEQNKKNPSTLIRSYFTTIWPGRHHHRLSSPSSSPPV